MLEPVAVRRRRHERVLERVLQRHVRPQSALARRPLQGLVRDHVERGVPHRNPGHRDRAVDEVKDVKSRRVEEPGVQDLPSQVEQKQVLRQHRTSQVSRRHEPSSGT